MMNFIFCILLLRLFGEISGAMLYALRGKPVVLFPNVTLDKNKNRLELYINGEHDYAHIATWELTSSTVNLKFSNNNIYMDKYRNIWMCHVSDKDEGKYTIKYIISGDNIVNNTTGPELELFIYEESTADKQLLECWGDHPGVSEKCSGGQRLEADPKITVVLVFVIILVVIITAAFIIMVMVNKVNIIAWIHWKKSIPQPVHVTSHHDSPDSTSYQLLWDKPDDGGYQLQKYIIRYREVHVKPETMEYELDWPLSPFIPVDNILHSDESCMLSALKPGKYYQVEIEAIFTQGQSSQNFIFKTKESVPQPVQVTSQRDSPNPTSYLLTWDKPDNGGSELQNYALRYQEVAIIPNKAKYELSWPLSPLFPVDNIAPSVLRYELSHLIPGRYYQVEIQAINIQGQSLPQSFIFRTKEGIPQPVHVTSHRDSPDSTSYQLLWDKPDDGGSPLQKYIISYREVQIKAERTDYELDWPLNPSVTEDNIPPSAVCYTLSDLKPGTYYQVETQAINEQGQSSPQSFIFKTKEMQTDSQLPVNKTSYSTPGEVSGTNKVQLPRKETSDAIANSPLNSL